MKLVNCSITSRGLTFLVLVVILLGQLADAEPIILESATLGPTGQTTGFIVGIHQSVTQFIGARFYISRQLEVTQIGGHISQTNSGGNFFGAIVPLSGPDGLPAGSPFIDGEVVASTVFDPGSPSSDFRTPLSVTLTPGFYALIFGTDTLGSTNGDGVMPKTGQTILPGVSLFVWNGSNWYGVGPQALRFVIEGNATGDLVYCDASGSNEGEYEHISGVQVGNINNKPTGNSHYADYTSLSTTMERETGYPFTITNGQPYNDDHCGIWVDWNQDGNFDLPNERISVSGSPGVGPYTGTITPPVDTVPGNTRMRVRITWNKIPLPCGHTGYGEVEDYTINISGGGVIYLKAIEDTYADSNNPDTNYGSLNEIASGRGGSSIYRAFLKFDLSSIPPGNVVTSATLRLDNSYISIPAPELDICRTHDRWDELTVTWNDQPGCTPLVINRALVSGDHTTWDVTDDVESDYVSDGFYSLTITSPDENLQQMASFWSKEVGVSDWAPTLEIEYEPIFGGGAGEPDDPYQIWNGEQFNTIGMYPNRWKKHYKLMADISLADYTGSSYNIIGISGDLYRGAGPFRGVFDGNYHSISDFSCSFNNRNYVGIFGYVFEGTIKNLKLVSPSLLDSYHNDMRYVGPIAGCADRGGILGCSVIGGTIEGQEYIGGLVGLPKGSFIAGCSSSASVSGNSSIGGLVGKGSTFGGGSSIVDSYAQGAVSGNEYVGGFIGDSSDVVILNCYSTGLVSGTTNTGGFSGYNVNQLPITNNVTACFWDVNSSTEPNSAAGTPLTTVQMYDRNTFINAGWDFVGETTNGCSDDWAMPPGGGYPVLWFELPVPPPLPTFAGGSGTAGDPYLIATEAQLNSIGHNPRLIDKHFRLISDLDLNGMKYYMIADEPYVFSGTFDGADHTISNILLEPGLNVSYFGFIGSIQNGAIIKDLTLVDPNIVSEWGWGVGSLTGINQNATITNCHALNANVMGLVSVGGLVGINYSYGRISGCSATGNVSENTFMSILSSSVGGLVGENTFWAEIDTSYAKCNVTGDDCVGGLVGSNILYSVITNCYSKGNVTGTVDHIGGLIGRNMALTEVDYCYSSSVVTGPAGTDAVGGFVGRMGTSGREHYTACFWDSEINPALPGIGNGIDLNVIGESTANMQTRSTFTGVGWDFVDESANGTDDIWDICEGMNYPKLSWQVLAADFLCPDGVNFIDYSFFASHWLEDNCALSNDCEGTDLDLLGSVDINDLAALVDNWLAAVE